MTPGGLSQRLLRGLSRVGLASPIYNITLGGFTPRDIEFIPSDPWPGDEDAANAMFQGDYRFLGESHNTAGDAPWGLTTQAASEAWLAEAHSFGWLRHFAATPGDTAARHARALVDSWIKVCGSWQDPAWRTDVLGRRLVAWLSNAQLLLDNTSTESRNAFLASLGRQYRHLARSAAKAEAGSARMAALTGLAFSGLCLPGGQRRLNKALAALSRELDIQVLADGVHVSRNPATHMEVLRHLITLRAALMEAGRDVPQALQNAIDRMTPMLRFFRLGDGTLATFNGGGEGVKADIDLVLAKADAKGRPPASAPHGGYQRLEAGKAIVVMDTGRSPPGRYSGRAHAGIMSFEASIGRQRLIVNCGPAPERRRSDGRRDEWQRVSRSSAAHSTLIIDDTSSARFKGGARLGHPIRRGPTEVAVSREDSEENTWVDAAHDGYNKLFGLVHRRRLFLSGSGDDLRGEDIITSPHPPDSASLPFAIRFHLHPDIKASLVQTGESALLQLPDGSGWKLRADGGTIALGESVYMGESGRVRRTDQIVITGTIIAGGAMVRWGLRSVRA